MEVVRNRIDTVWAPVDYVTTATAVTLYVGQLVTNSSATAALVTSGVTNMVAASGHSDTTNRFVPLGIVEATNNFTKTYSSTYGGAEYITSVNTGALQKARDFRGVEGRYPKNDGRAFVQLALVGPSTIIKAPIYRTTFGTTPSVFTVSGGITTGTAFTVNTVGVTLDAYNHTWHCRTGPNAGMQRVGYNTSATAQTFYIYFPETVTVGDTFCMAPLREFGTCRAQFDALGMFVDQAGDYGTNNYVIDVLKLDLRVAGEEYVEFKFNADQFGWARG